MKQIKCDTEPKSSNLLHSELSLIGKLQKLPALNAFTVFPNFVKKGESKSS